MTLIDQIRELIAEGDTERSLDELYKYVKENNADVIDTLVMLRNRLRGIQDEVIRGTMDNQSASLERAKINDAILKLLPQLTPEYMAKTAAWQHQAQPAAAATAKAKAPAASSGEKRKWMLIGGGAVVLLIIILIAVSGGGNGDHEDDDVTTTIDGTSGETMLDQVLKAHGGHAIWVTESDAEGSFSYFVFDEAKEIFEEIQGDNVFAVWSLQEETSEYVALFDARRQMKMRITETEAFFQNPGDSQWTKLKNGQWVTPE